MNWDFYNQLTGLFNFMTEPLWNYWGNFEGSPFIEVIVLGIIVLTSPSLIASSVGAMVYITNEVISKKIWWQAVAGLFLGKVTTTYIFVIILKWLEDDWSSVFLNTMGKMSGLVFLIVCIYWLRFAIIRKETKSRLSTSKLITAYLVGLLLFSLVDPGVILIFKMIESWVFNLNIGLLIPFLFTTVTIAPILVLSILVYGFDLDRLLKKRHKAKRLIQLLMLVLLIIVSCVQLILYWG